MRIAILTLGVVFAVTGCASSGGAPEAATSWGKPGVSLVDYWTDASQCALEGATTAADAGAGGLDTTRQASDSSRISGGGQAAANMRPNSPTGVEGSTNLNDTLSRARYNEMQRERAAQRTREAAVTTCLAGRGYRQFTLTAEQSAHLGTLPEGSRERREYLHQLGADAAVLNAQGL